MRTPLITAALAALLAHNARATDIPIRVIDEHGAPVKDAMFFCYTLGNSNISIPASWTPVSELDTLPDNVADFTSATIVASAPGMAWAAETINPTQHEGPITLTLDPGREISLTLNPAEGHEIPADLRPVLFDPAHDVPIWYVTMSHREDNLRPFSNAVPTSKNTYTVRVPSDLNTADLFINEPGFLRAFTVQDIDLTEDAIAIDLPAPGTLHVSIAPSQALPARYDSASISIMRDESLSMYVGTYIHKHNTGGVAGTLILNDLAPGQYGAFVISGAKGDADYFSTNLGANVKSNETAELTFEVSTYDEQRWRALHKGDDTLLIALALADGSPAANASYRLVDRIRMYDRTLELREGVANARGLIRIENANIKRAPELIVNGENVGYLFEKQAERDDTGAYRFTFAVEGTPTGATAPNIPFTDLKTGESMTMSDLKGKVVLLDIWASWCGPCQSVMAKNDELAARRTDWQGKAVILGLSVDKSEQAIRDHLKVRQWWNVTQALLTRNEEGKSPETYNKLFIKTIPHVLLIDQHGTIVKQGKPDDFDPETEIDTLLNTQTQ